MTKKAKLKVGAFVRIPLADGSFGYGRVLSQPYMAFYNYRTKEPSTDLDTIETQPIMFRQAVRILDYDRWTVLGERKLQGEVTEPIIRFQQDVVDYKKCIIFDNLGRERAATPEECIGLERAAVWEVEHIEQRLLDTFEGRPNPVEMNMRVQLE